MRKKAELHQSFSVIWLAPVLIRKLFSQRYFVDMIGLELKINSHGSRYQCLASTSFSRLKYRTDLQKKFSVFILNKQHCPLKSLNYFRNFNFILICLFLG